MLVWICTFAILEATVGILMKTFILGKWKYLPCFYSDLILFLYRTSGPEKCFTRPQFGILQDNDCLAIHLLQCHSSSVVLDINV